MRPSIFVIIIGAGLPIDPLEITFQEVEPLATRVIPPRPWPNWTPEQKREQRRQQRRARDRERREA